ncbi:hypothetical protein SAMN02745218_01215 [Desulfofundulus australicus DSM 11792]|uniref:Uncharacterized protein n=1 Tax=Desulfofundulus australicus DSM 11792 TaxID=1121425 RepID=A0A1M4XZ15_9FIRM|nr:pilin [Desulfofundulus australicus]SHE98482.1 hypothetical protein SAMN02745218_01215 [Desulfofundulus australicus DSM 11792]
MRLLSRKLLPVFLLLFTFVLPLTAAAGPPYRVKDLSNLRAVAYPSGRVEVSWNVQVYEVPPSFPNAKVYVYRVSADGGKEQVAALEVPPDAPVGSYFQMSCSDTPPAKGKYTYYALSNDTESNKYTVDTSAVTEEGDPGVPNSGKTDVEVRPGLFTPEQWNTIMWWYGILTSISGGFLVMVVVRSGYRHMVSGLNPGMRASFIEDVQRCILAMVLIVLAPVLVKLLIAINDGFVSLFASVVKQAAVNAQMAKPEQLDKAGMFEQVLALPFQAVLDIIQKIFGLAPIEQLVFNSKDLNLIAGAGTIETGNVFANALLNLALAAFTVYFNAVYTIRHWVVTAALVATPLITWIWVLTSERQVIEIWAAEIFQTIFLQSAHALTLGIFLSVLCGAAGGGIDTSWLGGGLRDIAVWFASFGGAVCVMVIVFLGYRYMTARNEKEFAQAREGLVRALIGLAILGLSLTIAGFLVYLFNGKWY